MQVLHAVYDGKVLLPKEKVDFPPNTEVIVTIDNLSARPKERGLFIKTALSLNLEGPSDLSEKMHEYLYGEGSRGDETSSLP